jgi:hypothetical protein
VHQTESSANRYQRIPWPGSGLFREV